jgi:release factor glutamine methyltransferase
MPFRVSPATLVPRPETETVVDAALAAVGAEGLIRPLRIADLGTGSGVLLLSLLSELPHARGIGTDISEEALVVARANAACLGFATRASFIAGDFGAALAGGFDLIVSNPPYVSAGALPGLQREVRDHEPVVALSPGSDGLSVIRRLLNDAPAFLLPNGRLLMEIGFDQGERVQQLVDERVWKMQDILPDLQGIPRIVVLEKK